MKALAWSLLAGLIFGAGLCVSGMTNPENITRFLDVTGDWSPNLAGVMVGAIAVHAAWLRWGARSSAAAPGSPSARKASAPRAPIDGALIGGAALFGVGWGLSGYCPGPAIVALGRGALGPFVFASAMVGGILLSQWRSRVFARRLGARHASLETPTANACGE